MQNADGTFPPVGTVLTIVDNRGHTTWSPVAPPVPALPKIRYFTFSNQNAIDPVDAALTWPVATWSETGQIDAGKVIPEWICSVVGISFNYTTDPIAFRQISSLCYFTPTSGWSLKRIMIDAFGPPSGFMGFHIMAVPAAMADDRR